MSLEITHQANIQKDLLNRNIQFHCYNYVLNVIDQDSPRNKHKNQYGKVKNKMYLYINDCVAVY